MPTTSLVRFSTITLAAISLLVLPACSVNVKKGEGGEDKKVDIETPFGGIHVDKGADVRDTGLAVYPGARVKQKDEPGQEKSANVTMSGMGYGLKVVAIQYESDDSPSKIIAYYKDQLKKYGNVLECHTAKHGGSFNRDHGDDSDSRELKCEGDNSGSTVELKVGTQSNQHIVSIEPQDKGADFALVYVKTYGKDTI
jgi:hypothetical protein